MKFFFPSLLLIMQIHAGLAQSTGDENDRAWQQLITDQNAFLPVIDKGNSDVKGSPYLNDEWTLGRLITKDSTILDGASLKYNIFNDELLFTNRRVNQTVALDNSVIQAFDLYDSLETKRNFRFNSFDSSSDEFVSGFYEILYDGNNKLFVRLSKSYIEADYTGAYNTGRRYDEFQDNTPKYFLRRADGSWFRLTKSKSSLEKAMVDKFDEVEDYIRNNKLKTKNPDDIVRIVEYYDRL